MTAWDHTPPSVRISVNASHILKDTLNFHLHYADLGDSDVGDPGNQQGQAG